MAWLHGEWLERANPCEQDPVLAYAARYQQMQLHLGEGAVPMTLVALVQGQPVGCISLTRLQATSARFAGALWMSNLFVMPSERGQGIASALLLAAEQQALQLNERVLYLFTDSAADFYRRRGWQQCSASRLELRDDSHVCVFKKLLTKNSKLRESTAP